MKSKTILTSLLILFGLFATTSVSYALARLLPDPEPSLAPIRPPLSVANLPSQTSNRYTAVIESYYADASRLVFQVRVTGGEGSIANVNLNDETGNYINASTGWGNISSDPTLTQIEFELVTPQAGDRLQGQLLFTYNRSSFDETQLASFSFDLDLPIEPANVFLVNQSMTANGVDMMVERVVMTPAFTHVYLCYDLPSQADWAIGGMGTSPFIEIEGQQTGISSYSLLFDSAFGDGTKGGEPGWKAPVIEGRCVKLGFANGEANPSRLKLIIPSLEQSMPEVVPQEKLDAAYPKLLAQGIDMQWITLDHGSTVEWRKLPLGITEQEAMRKFIEALGYIYPGPWEFVITLQ